MSPEFDAYGLLNSRIDGLERRVAQMDAELTQTVAKGGETHLAVASLTDHVGRMTESFREFRTALYAVAAIIVGAAVLVIILGQHP